VHERQRLPDADLSANAPGILGPADWMEMQRRLKVAIAELTGQRARLPSAGCARTLVKGASLSDR